MDISPEGRNTQETIHISNDAQEEEEEAPGSGKAQCNIVGEYQDREAGRGWLGNMGRKEGLWDFQGGGILEMDNHLKCK